MPLSENKNNNIRDQIVDKRRRRIEAEGYAMGQTIPGRRQTPIVPFGRPPVLICEIKRRSPSRGNIKTDMDPVAQARAYYRAGVRSVSILTEEDYFSGSLADLMAVKQAFPDLAVLRKDFLIDETDVEWSYRAGADAILLIAAMLSGPTLAAMLGRAEVLGMTALVEVHTAAEIDQVRSLRPNLVGINCRDLQTFQIDRLLPVRLRHLIDWPCQVIFESGIFAGEDVTFASLHGFSGVLVGEAVVRNPNLVADLQIALKSQAQPAGQTSHPQPSRFWSAVGQLLDSRPRPLVKICGLTNQVDAEAAFQAGADFLGFVFAKSPRQADEALVRQVGHLPILKVAVVVARQATDDPALPAEVQRLLAEGLIDAVQFHGDETLQDCVQLAYPYFKAFRLKSLTDVTKVQAYRSPRVLIDAWSATAYGGTGQVLAGELIRAIAKTGPLWLAGGIGPENVAAIVKQHQPELLDVSSSLEQAPGQKDHRKLQAFFKELRS